jgi:ABC-type antimicrobial peptide transport system permease subunit
LLGVATTAGLSQVIRRTLFGISGLDPVSYSGAVLLLLMVLTAAALIPIRRAFRMDVVRILHAE